jgi:phospholipase/lecithinase/hemolysin
MAHWFAMKLFLTACTIVLLTMTARAQVTPAINRLYVFGDSYSDIGEGYLDGNGPTAVAYLADDLGFKLYPSNVADVSGKSLDFAVSGAQTGDGSGRKVKDALLGYGMRRQVDDFAAMVKAHKDRLRSEDDAVFPCRRPQRSQADERDDHRESRRRDQDTLRAWRSPL